MASLNYAGGIFCRVADDPQFYVYSLATEIISLFRYVAFGSRNLLCSTLTKQINLIKLVPLLRGQDLFDYLAHKQILSQASCLSISCKTSSATA